MLTTPPLVFLLSRLCLAAKSKQASFELELPNSALPLLGKLRAQGMLASYKVLMRGPRSLHVRCYLNYERLSAVGAEVVFYAPHQTRQTLTLSQLRLLEARSKGAFFLETQHGVLTGVECVQRRCGGRLLCRFVLYYALQRSFALKPTSGLFFWPLSSPLY